MGTRLSKLDKALDVIAEVFFDPAQRFVTNKEGQREAEDFNRQAWAQRDILQAIAWKANSALDRENGADERMARVRAEASKLQNTPQTEFDYEAAKRVAQDAEFWGFQQQSLETLMAAASEALVRHGHEAYTRTNLRRTRTSSNPARNMDEAKMAGILSNLGLTLPERDV